MAGTQKLSKFEVAGGAPDAPASSESAERAAAAAIAQLEPSVVLEALGETASSARDRTPDELRTQLARKFVDLADTVTRAFRELTIGAGAWGVELTAPNGMSTGGGKQALQHLRLRPRRPGYAVFVGGTVNQVARSAELRDFDHVAAVHEVRFRKAIRITRQEWEDFLRKAEVVLNAAGIQSMRTPPPRELLEQRRKMVHTSKTAVGALVLVAILVAIVLWRVALKVLAASG